MFGLFRTEEQKAVDEMREEFLEDGKEIAVETKIQRHLFVSIHDFILKNIDEDRKPRYQYAYGRTMDYLNASVDHFEKISVILEDPKSTWDDLGKIVKMIDKRRKLDKRIDKQLDYVQGIAREFAEKYPEMIEIATEAEIELSDKEAQIAAKVFGRDDFLVKVS